MVLHQYNILGCWVLTLGLATAKVYGRIDLDWLYVLSPVLTINGWFFAVAIWRRIGAMFS